MKLLVTVVTEKENKLDTVTNTNIAIIGVKRELEFGVFSIDEKALVSSVEKFVKSVTPEDGRVISVSHSFLP